MTGHIRSMNTFDHLQDFYTNCLTRWLSMADRVCPIQNSRQAWIRAVNTLDTMISILLFTLIWQQNHGISTWRDCRFCVLTSAGSLWEVYTYYIRAAHKIGASALIKFAPIYAFTAMRLFTVTNLTFARSRWTQNRPIIITMLTIGNRPDDDIMLIVLSSNNQVNKNRLV